MIIRKFSILFLLLLLKHFALAQEIRSSLVYKIDLTKKLSSEIEFGARNETINKSSQQYYFALVDVKQELTKAIKLAGDFRLGKANQNETMIQFDEDYSIYRYGFQTIISPQTKNSEYQWSYRLRFQNSYESDNKHQETIRHRIQANRDYNKYFEPYISLEAYFNLEKNEFKKLRFKIGTEIKFDSFDFEVFILTDNTIKTEHYLNYQQSQAFGIKLLL